MSTSKTPLYLYYEALLRGRLPTQDERQIVGDPVIAADYAADVIRGPWPAAEPIIMADRAAADYYREGLKEALRKGAK